MSKEQKNGDAQFQAILKDLDKGIKTKDPKKALEAFQKGLQPLNVKDKKEYKEYEDILLTITGEYLNDDQHVTPEAFKLGAMAAFAAARGDDDTSHYINALKYVGIKDKKTQEQYISLISNLSQLGEGTTEEKRVRAVKMAMIHARNPFDKSILDKSLKDLRVKLAKKPLSMSNDEKTKKFMLEGKLEALKNKTEEIDDTLKNLTGIDLKLASLPKILHEVEIASQSKQNDLSSEGYDGHTNRYPEFRPASSLNSFNAPKTDKVLPDSAKIPVLNPQVKARRSNALVAPVAPVAPVVTNNTRAVKSQTDVDFLFNTPEERAYIKTLQHHLDSMKNISGLKFPTSNHASDLLEENEKQEFNTTKDAIMKHLDKMPQTASLDFIDKTQKFIQSNLNKIPDTNVITFKDLQVSRRISNLKSTLLRKEQLAYEKKMENDFDTRAKVLEEGKKATSGLGSLIKKTVKTLLPKWGKKQNSNELHK